MGHLRKIPFQSAPLFTSNKPFKGALARKFNAWFSDQVRGALTTNRNIADTQRCFKISTPKPLHAFDFATQHTVVLKHGLGQPGLQAVIMIDSD